MRVNVIEVGGWGRGRGRGEGEGGRGMNDIEQMILSEYSNRQI
jgi:hypothetical protein